MPLNFQHFEKHHGGALLSPAHLGTQGLGLAIGQPAIEGKATAHGLQVKQQHVDALIGPATAQVDRGRQAGATPPGAEPGRSTGFQCGNDAVSHGLVEIDLGHRNLQK